VVSTNNVDKPDADLRKFIRSHVMQGKNLGKKLPSRRKKREPDPAAKEAQHSTSSPDDATVVNVVEAVEIVAPAISRRFSSTLATIPLADTVELGRLEAVIQCKQLLFTLHVAPAAAAAAESLTLSKSRP
jgi:hypothetical protein